MDKIRIGIIGAGIMGHTHAKSFKENPKSEVVAIADIVEEKAKNLANIVNAKYYSNYEKMLKEEEIDAVVISTPDFLHKDPVIVSAEYGKNLFIEKPFATTIEDAKEMLNAIEKNKVKAMVNYSMRWNPLFVASKIIMDEKYIGEPIFAHIVHNDRIDVPLEMWGGIKETWAKNTTIADFLMSHDVDAIRWICKKEAKKVYAVSCKKVLKFTPDGYQAIVSFEDNFNVIFEANWILARSKPNLVDGFFSIYASKGTINAQWHTMGFDIMSTRGMEVSFNEEVEINDLVKIKKKLEEYGIVCRIILESDWSYQMENREIKEYSRVINIPLEAASPPRSPHKIKFYQGDPYEHFIECLQKNIQPICSATDGYKQTQIICAIKESARDGKIIELTI
jgi:predicted dehydrogenase